MLDVWVPLVGPKRVHVVTVPPRGTDETLLWRRFAKVVGVDPTVCSELPQDSNPSLGHASSELLRRVNAALGERHPMDYDQVVRNGLARQILAQRTHLESPVRLNQRGVRFARRWNNQVREAIAAHGVRVVGSLDDLPIDLNGSDVPEKLPSPSPSELLAAAVTARDGLAAMALQLASRLENEPADPAPDLPTPPDRWDAEEEPVEAAVVEVTVLTRRCLELSRRLNDA